MVADDLTACAANKAVDEAANQTFNKDVQAAFQKM
jgi:hypothetical protein